MVSPVEEVAEADYSGSFSGKVQRQRRRGLAQNANYRVELLSTILEVGAGYEKIGSAGSCNGREEYAILLIPEPVAGFRAKGSWDNHHRPDSIGGGSRRVRQRSLRERAGTKRPTAKQNQSVRRKKLEKSAGCHKCSPEQRSTIRKRNSEASPRALEARQTLKNVRYKHSAQSEKNASCAQFCRFESILELHINTPPAGHFL